METVLQPRIGETREHIDVRAARRLLQHSAVERAADIELAGMADELSTELALLQGDIEARDFSLFDETTLRNGIAYLECQLQEIVRQAHRRLRSRRARYSGELESIDAYRNRFDAMRCADIVEAIETLGTPLEKRGREFWGLCPFHEERTPSFAVNSAKGVWHCHGCQRGGDLVGFMMQRHHLNPVEALHFLEELIDVPGVAA